MKEVNVNVIRGACLSSTVLPPGNALKRYSWPMYFLLTANSPKL